MPDPLRPDDDLVRRLPLPLAQLYRRACNAKSDLELHQASFYLWEAALKLLGAICVVEYARLDAGDPALDECLQNLARPALGHWWQFARQLTPRLAERGVAGFAAVRDLLRRRSDELPRVAGLETVLQQESDGYAAARASVQVDKFLDRLVNYRNREIGHGATGLQRAAFYGRLGRALLAGAAELFGRLDVLAGRRLVYVAEVRQVGGIWRVERFELAGESARRLETLELPRDRAAALPDGDRVYLVGRGAGLDPADLTPLHPLVVLDLEANECSFLSARRGRERAEFLCYTNGQWTTRADLDGEQRALLGRALRLPAVSPKEAAARAVRSQADESPDEEPPRDERQMLGEYELLSELGRGGMGVVYRARQPALGRYVALKCLLRPGDEKAERRFRREIRALGRVDHPHLMKVFASGADGDRWFYVMELVEGPSLAAVAEKLSATGAATAVDLSAWQAAVSTAADEQRAREKSLSDGATAETGSDRSEVPVSLPRPVAASKPPPAAGVVRAGRGYADRVAALVRQAAEAAEALHRQGVVHRDIKPGNILVDAAGERATLMDLGLAQLADDVEGKLTRTRQFVGTLRYASPEQVLAATAVDRRSDVYSLGATLWELLALRPLFGATEATPTPALMQTIQRDDPQRLSECHPGIARDLEAVVHKCLEKRPADRYPTAQELADDLGRYLDGEPVRARPAGWLDRRLKWVRRHPKEAAAYGLAALTAVLLLIGGTFAQLWRSASTARQQAVASLEEARSAQTEAERSRDAARQAEASERGARTELAAATQREQEALHGEVAANKRAEAIAREQIAEFHYVEAIRRAQRFLESGKGDLALSELRATEPSRRNWEWRYLREQMPQILRGHEEGVNSVIFSPDARWLASGSSDNTVRVWDLAAGGEPLVLRGHGKWVTSLSFSPDGRRLASGSGDKTVRVWDLAAGGEPLVLRGHDSEVESVSFSPEGLQLASGSEDKTVRVWDLAVGAERLVLRGHTKRVACVTFSPDGRRLASASFDNTVRVWDLAGGSEPLVLRGHVDWVESVCFSPDGRRLASGSSDKTVRVWDLAAVSEPRILKGHEFSVTSVAFSPDGRRLASGSGDNTVLVWDLTGGSGPRVLRGHEYHVKCVAFSPDGRRLASGSGDNTVRVWDLAAAGDALVLLGHRYHVTSMAFSPDGRQLASGSLDRTVRIWDLAGGGEPRVLWGHKDSVRSVAFSPDGQRLASGSDDNTVRVWDLALDGYPIVLRGHEGKVSCVTFSPDGRRLASGSEDKTVRVWDLAAGGQPLVLRGHDGAVFSVSFSPDGRRLASSSFDRTVRVWDLAAGSEILVVRGRDEFTWSVTFSPDGRRLGIGSGEATSEAWVMGDETMRVWETGCGHLWRLRQVMSSERAGDEFSARFHLGWLWKEELGQQALEAASGLTSPIPLGSAATILALQSREERTPLADILRRRHRARLGLEDRDGAEADFRHLRAMQEDTAGVWRERVWSRLHAARPREIQEEAPAILCALAGGLGGPLAGLAVLGCRQAAGMAAFLEAWGDMERSTRLYERSTAKDIACTVGNLARTRLLVPDGLGEDGAERLEVLGSLAVDRDPDSTDHLETYGAALYRAGKYREAAEQLQAAVDNSDGQGSVWVQCFLAMTYYQLRDEKEEPLFSVGAAAGPLAWAHLHRTHEQSARDWLTKAVRQIENKENPDWKSSNGSDRKPDWESRVQWFYLRREAEATLRWSVPPGKTRHW